MNDGSFRFVTFIFSYNNKIKIAEHFSLVGITEKGKRISIQFEKEIT